MSKATLTIPVKIDFRPWCTQLIDETKEMLIKCVENGMPEAVAVEVLKSVIRTATDDGISVQLRDSEREIGFKCEGEGVLKNE